MKRNFYILFFLYSILSIQYSFAQNRDSLWKVYNDRSQTDTNRLKAIQAIAWTYFKANPDSAIVLSELERQLAVKAKANLPAGKAEKYESKALNTMGASYLNRGNYPKALEYFFKTLKVNEAIGNKKGIGASYNNIGNVFKDERNHAKALEYYFKSLKIKEEIGDKKGTGATCSNIGIVYYNQANYSKALEYYTKYLRVCEELQDKEGIATSYNNISNVYAEQKDYKRSLELNLKALVLYKELEDEQGLVPCYNNISQLYADLYDYKRALQYSDSALQMSIKTGDLEGKQAAYNNFSIIYERTGKFKEAYENHVLFKEVIDSIFNADNSKQLGDLKTKFEVEKKEAELKVKSEAEHEKIKVVALEEKKRQNVIIFAVAGVLILVVVFSLFLLNRFRITQRQKVIIEKQKQHVDRAFEQLHEKNKEVMDSINYASRIQRALLPSVKYIAGSLNRLMKD